MIYYLLFIINNKLINHKLKKKLKNKLVDFFHTPIRYYLIVTQEYVNNQLMSRLPTLFIDYDRYR